MLNFYINPQAFPPLGRRRNSWPIRLCAGQSSPGRISDVRKGRQRSTPFPPDIPYSPWCGRRDLNPHTTEVTEPKSVESTNSTTPAYSVIFLSLHGKASEVEVYAWPTIIKTGKPAFTGQRSKNGLRNGKTFAEVTALMSAAVDADNQHQKEDLRLHDPSADASFCFFFAPVTNCIFTVLASPCEEK